MEKTETDIESSEVIKEDESAANNDAAAGYYWLIEQEELQLVPFQIYINNEKHFILNQRFLFS